MIDHRSMVKHFCSKAVDVFIFRTSKHFNYRLGSFSSVTASGLLFGNVQCPEQANNC